MVVHYPRTVWKNSDAEYEVTGKTYNLKKRKKKKSIPGIYVNCQNEFINMFSHAITSPRYTPSSHSVLFTSKYPDVSLTFISLVMVLQCT